MNNLYEPILDKAEIDLWLDNHKKEIPFSDNEVFIIKSTFDRLSSEISFKASNLDSGINWRYNFIPTEYKINVIRSDFSKFRVTIGSNEIILIKKHYDNWISLSFVKISSDGTYTHIKNICVCDEIEGFLDFSNKCLFSHKFIDYLSKNAN